MKFTFLKIYYVKCLITIIIMNSIWRSELVSQVCPALCSCLSDTCMVVILLDSKMQSVFVGLVFISTGV